MEHYDLSQQRELFAILEEAISREDHDHDRYAEAAKLTDLVDMGMVQIPTVVRMVKLGRPIPREERRALSRTLDALVERHLKNAICPGTWEWTEAGELSLVFTPLTKPDASLVERMTSAFASDVRAALRTLAMAAPSEPLSAKTARSPVTPSFEKG